MILTAIGAAAGVISGRFRDALASWAGALIGAALAYQATYTIDPSWPRSETPFEVWVVYAAVFLLPFIAGGHLLGATIANRAAETYDPANVKTEESLVSASSSSRLVCTRYEARRSRPAGR